MGGRLMRTIIASAAVALILALIGTPLAIWVSGRRGSGQLMVEEGPAQATGRGTPAMGGAVVVVASLVGYVVGHVLAGEPMAVSGVLVLGLMTGLGLVGFAGDIIKIRGRRSPGQRGGASLAHGLDGIQAGAAIVVLAGYVLVLNWQLRSDCSA